MYEKTFGAKYDDKLSRKEIAARIRADLKAAQKSGELPAFLKISTRVDGRSIDCKIVAVAEGFKIQSETALHGEFGPGRYRHTEEARALLDKINAIHGAYNFDGSDMQSDYFNVNYYGSATFDWQLESAERKAAELSARAHEAASQISAEVQS